ncbi:MAG: hypothetical protein JO154_01830 [Chitinophaga sp.]|uniref:hypothetical protein n=1 Tax=Chitinophaga sp. TaxID=1869181 RepID=UPI0025C0615A|nr:hypothetical protein [Chitinophaga sp.]MBV8251319.1 hypothetical protein [Chitinophaga sp.]
MSKRKLRTGYSIAAFIVVLLTCWNRLHFPINPIDIGGAILFTALFLMWSAIRIEEYHERNIAWKEQIRFVMMATDLIAIPLSCHVYSWCPALGRHFHVKEGDMLNPLLLMMLASVMNLIMIIIVRVIKKIKGIPKQAPTK